MNKMDAAQLISLDDDENTNVESVTDVGDQENANAMNNHMFDETPHVVHIALQIVQKGFTKIADYVFITQYYFRKLGVDEHGIPVAFQGFKSLAAYQLFASRGILWKVLKRYHWTVLKRSSDGIPKRVRVKEDGMEYWKTLFSDSYQFCKPQSVWRQPMPLAKRNLGINHFSNDKDVYDYVKRMVQNRFESII